MKFRRNKNLLKRQITFVDIYTQLLKEKDDIIKIGLY